MNALSFYIDDKLYAVDVNTAQKFVRNMAYTPVLAAPKAITGIANLKGRVVTVFNLRELLGQNDEQSDEYYNKNNLINAIIFKSLTAGGESQIGLIIDKPGEMIEIDDSLIHPPNLATGAEESQCISGIAEINNQLFRIISLDSFVINK